MTDKIDKININIGLAQQYGDQIVPDLLQDWAKSQSQIAYAPTVETKTSYDVSSAYDKGFITAMKLYSRPQGEWINLIDIKNLYKCSICGRTIGLTHNETLSDYPFCHCGADMRGKKDE